MIIESLPLSEMYQHKVFHRNFDTGELELDCEILKDYNVDLYEMLIKEPEKFIELSKEGIKETLEVFPGRFDSNGNIIESSTLPKNLLHFKIINLKNNIYISNIQHEHLNKLYTLNGIIKRLTKRIPRTKAISFECLSCGAKIKVIQTSKKIVIPSQCSCKEKKHFREIDSIKESIQELVLEEMPEEMGLNQPQQIRVYLEGELTSPDFSSKLQPGKRIEIIGIIKETPKFMKKSDIEENINEFILDAVNIESLEEEDDTIISEKDMEEITRISYSHPLDALSKNLAPSIYGHEMIKKAVVLQLVKSVKKQRGDGTFVRGDLHILLVGDPGVAKSHLLKATILRCPRARYASGTKSSTVGLTSMVKKDELTGTFSLEAGLIVLANGSLLCLDEMEKIEKENLSGLYEPLETQVVSVNKAGISASMKAETSLLAAANPSKGKFGLSLPLATQIDLPPPLLNRFDLIFVIIDKGEESEDAKSVEHIFNTYCDGENCQGITIESNLFKKYIAYARKIQPKINKELLGEIKEFYKKYRSLSHNNKGTSGIPINLRNVEALIRLSTAHAKLRLSEYVEKEDLEVARNIFEYSLKQVGFDESGVLDMSKLTEKVPYTKRSKMDRVIQIMITLTNRIGKLLPYAEIIQESEKIDINKYELNDLLEELKRIGQIYEPRKSYFELL